MLRGAVVMVMSLMCGVAAAQVVEHFPGKQWDEASPVAAGWDMEKLTKASEYAKREGATAMMVVQHGVVGAKGGDLAERTELHSCRKSFLSALMGLAVERKQVQLDATLESLGMDDVAPSLTREEKQATVREMLEARSGVYHDSAYETKGMEEKRPARGSHAPGTFWYYNNWDFNTLGAIYEKATGQGIFPALEKQIAQPIGMQDFRASDGRYERESSSRFPAYPMRMSARDLARFALLYLHGGDWDGKQVVPAEWVKASLHPYSDTESGGYGYLWWTGDSATPGREAEYRFPPGSFWLEGHLGQYAVVVPSRDLVVVVRVKGSHPEHKIAKRQAAALVRMVVAAAPK